MSMISVGDMAQQFVSMRTGGTIKSDLAELAESLSTGRVTDITSTLNGQTVRFSGINYRLDQLEAFSGTLTETAQYLADVQTVLAQVKEIGDLTADRLLLVNDSSTRAQIDEAAKSSAFAFDAIVQSVNTRIADRALLSGAAVDRSPLAPAADMLANIIATIPAGADSGAISAIVDDWFTAPLGGFATMGYLGDTGGGIDKKISDSKIVGLDTRGDDPALVSLLKATALAAVASELPALDQGTRKDLLQTAGRQLFDAAPDFVAMQAQVGFTEAVVESTMAENAAQTVSLEIAQNGLINADPFETATKLQAVQLQLETHFAVTARMGQLSLLRYI